MEDLLKKFWKAVTAYPNSFDDYVAVGRWLIYKKLLVLLVALSVLLLGLLAWWLVRPAPPFALPVFYRSDEALKAFSGEAVLLDEAGRVTYRGQISAGVCAGRGRQFVPPDNTLLYEGGFLDGVYSGKGKLYSNGVLLYEGGFLDGRYSGSGTLRKGEKICYVGQFAQGQYSGAGALYQEGNLLYEGDFLGGLYSGVGTLYHQDGAVLYTGGFAKGKYSGQGVQTTPDGITVYEGEFSGGLYDGEGCLYARDGVRPVFQGNFIKGEPNRCGTLYNAQGQVLYEGNVYSGGVDYIGLLGLSLPELEKQVRELPAIYYDSACVGYLYRELGFAVITQYNYGEAELPVEQEWEDGQAEPSALGDETALFAQPADNLVVHTILVEGLRLSPQIPTKGTVAVERTSMTGFEAFMEHRLALLQRPGQEPPFAVEVVTKGDHLYRVSGVPETVSCKKAGVVRDMVYYLYREEELSKGGVPAVIVCKKSQFGG